MKLVVFVAATLLAVSNVKAADINCGGRVSLVMADHPACNGNMAFKTEGSGGSGGIWMCTKSKEADAAVLSAFLAEKIVGAFIEGGDAGGVCTQIPGYRQISYIIVYP